MKLLKLLISIISKKKFIWENFRIMMTQKMEIFVFGVNLKTIDTKMKKSLKFWNHNIAQKAHKSFHVIIQFHRFMIIYFKTLNVIEYKHFLWSWCEKRPLNLRGLLKLFGLNYFIDLIQLNYHFNNITGVKSLW